VCRERVVCSFTVPFDTTACAVCWWFLYCAVVDKMLWLPACHRCCTAAAHAGLACVTYCGTQSSSYKNSIVTISSLRLFSFTCFVFAHFSGTWRIRSWPLPRICVVPVGLLTASTTRLVTAHSIAFCQSLLAALPILTTSAVGLYVCCD
jgi:hypothetical protein